MTKINNTIFKNNAEILINFNILIVQHIGTYTGLYLKNLIIFINIIIYNVSLDNIMCRNVINNVYKVSILNLVVVFI